LIAPETIVVCQECSLTIQARNGSGQEIKSGGDQFQVSAGGPEPPQNLMLMDMNNGTYVLSFTVLAPGGYQFHVTLNGQHIKGSPLRLSAVKPESSMHKRHIEIKM